MDDTKYEPDEDEEPSTAVVTAVAKPHDGNILDQQWRINEDIDTDALDRPSKSTVSRWPSSSRPIPRRPRSVPTGAGLRSAGSNHAASADARPGCCELLR